MHKRTLKLTMMILAPLVVLVVGVSPCLATVTHYTPAQWAGNNHWYQLVRNDTAPGWTWTEARDAAAADTYLGMQGHLVTLTSQEENDFVGNPAFLGDAYHDLYGDVVWIGGHQFDKLAEPAGHWAWVTGEPWAWTNWHPWGAPDNGGPHNVQDYLVLTANQWGTGTWNDVDHGTSPAGGSQWAYIVEYETAQVPEPSSILIWSVIGAIGVTIGWRRRQAI